MRRYSSVKCLDGSYMVLSFLIYVQTVSTIFFLFSVQDNVQDLKRRITVLDCQLRKSEMTRKAFEVSTEKLLQFVEVSYCLDFLKVKPIQCKI